MWRILNWLTKSYGKFIIHNLISLEQKKYQPAMLFSVGIGILCECDTKIAARVVQQIPKSPAEEEGLSRLFIMRR